MEEAFPHGPPGLSPLSPSSPALSNNPSRRRSRSASLEPLFSKHSLSPASPPRSCEEVLASYGMAPLSFSMDDQHEDPSCHHVTTSCKECEADHGLCCVCMQPGMRARYAKTMQAVRRAQALPDLFDSPETRHKALQTSAHLELPDILFPTLAPSPLAPAVYPDRSVSFSPRLTGNGIISNLVNTSLYGGGEADPSLPTLSGHRVLGVRSGTDSLRGVSLSRAGHSSRAKPPCPLPQLPPLSGTHLPGAAAAHPNAGAGRNPMSQRHSIPTSGAAVLAALRVKKCHHSSPCRSCRLDNKCCMCLSKLACSSARIRGGRPLAWVAF